MIHSLFFAVITLCVQIFLYLFVFTEYRGIKMNAKLALSFAAMEVLRVVLFGGMTTVIFVVVEFYLLGKFLLKDKSHLTSIFYSVYAFCFSFALSNFFNVIFQEVTSLETFDKYYLLFWFISVLLSIFTHLIVFKIVKIDVSPLADDDEFVKDTIIKPLAKFLSIATIILLIVHYFEIGFDRHIVSNYAKHIIFAYVSMLVAMVVLLHHKIDGYRKEIARRDKEEEYRILDLYTNDIEKKHDTIRGFKHDYKNMLISLDDSIRTGDVGKVKYLYDEILVTANLSMDEGEAIDDLSKIENSPLKSLLYWKITEARQKGVVVHIEIKNKINQVNMALLDFIRIISILVDNAIEAALETIRPEMTFALVKQGKDIIIYVKNTILQLPKSLAQLYKNNYSTKGEGRGTGLFSVSQIVDRYVNVYLETELDGENFVQVVHIGG